MRISLSLFIVILITTTVGASAGYYGSRFYDVPTNHWAARSIDFVASQGLMYGKQNGAFEPGNTVTRAELAVVLHRLYTNRNFAGQYGYGATSSFNTYNNYTTPYAYTNYTETQLEQIRREDVKKIADALQRYAQANNGVFPKTIKKNTFKEVCETSIGEDCKNSIDLSVLLGTYIQSIPRDPTLRDSRDSTTAYMVKVDDDNRVHVVSQLTKTSILEVRSGE
jgi:hypothetical protein